MLIVAHDTLNDTYTHAVGHPWTSDQPDAVTSTWPHKHSQQTDISTSGEVRTHNPSKRAAANPRLRPRGDGDRRFQSFCCCLSRCRH